MGRAKQEMLEMQDRMNHHLIDDQVYGEEVQEIVENIESLQTEFKRLSVDLTRHYFDRGDIALEAEIAHELSANITALCEAYTRLEEIETQHYSED